MRHLIFYLVLLFNFNWAISYTAFAAVTEHEPNNTLEDAFLISVNDEPKTYKFYYFDDEDWFTFYARKGDIYDIEILKSTVDKGINPALEIYDAEGNLERTHDFGFTGEGELLPEFHPPQDGYYYVRVVNKELTFSENTHYDLRIYLPYLPNNLWVTGTVLDQCSQTPVKNKVEIVTDKTEAKLAKKNGTFSFDFPPGRYTFTARANKYIEQSQTVAVEKIAAEQYVPIALQFSLSPTQGCSSSPAPPPVNQEQLKQSAVAEYNDSTGELIVKDVRVGSNRPILAQLKKQPPFRFKLTKTVFLTKQEYSPTPAFYNNDTLLVDIPTVFAFGKLYKVKMKNIAGNNYLFELVGNPVELRQ